MESAFQRETEWSGASHTDFFCDYTLYPQSALHVCSEEVFGAGLVLVRGSQLSGA